MASKLKGDGCKILTAMTAIVTAQCEKCNSVFQVPINSNSGFVVGEK